MTFLETPSPLTQLTEFEVGETFGIIASVDEDDTCSESDDVFVEVHDLDTTSLGKSCADVLVVGSPSSDLVDHVSSDSLDMLYASASCSPPSHSPECCDMLLIDSLVMLEGIEADCSESLGAFEGMTPRFILIIYT